MEKIKTAQRTIDTSDITMDNNNFFSIQGIIHKYSLYDSYANENKELVIILRQVSYVREVINEAIITCHKDATSSVILNRYSF